MRVAIMAEVFLPKVDGVVHRTLNLIRQLNQLDDEVLIVCPDADGCTNCSATVVPIPSFSFPPYPEYRIGLPDARLQSAVAGFKPDVIHYVNPFAFGFRCFDALHRAGLQLPTVFSFHTLYGEFVKKYATLKPLSKVLWWMTRQYHNRADVNLTVSNIMREELIRRGFQRVRCWPPAVDGELFHPDRSDAATRSRLTGRPEQPLLLTVSRLAPEKSVGFLSGVLDRLPHVSLAIVGDGPQRDELQRQFSNRDVRFVGYLKGPELAAAYASADAFVYASETETMGNVVLEAMACGCPVIAPRAGGIPDLVTHTETGMLYQPGNVENATDCVKSVLFDELRQARLRRRSREATKTWTWAKAIDRVRECYLEAKALHSPRVTKATWGQRSASAVTTALVTAIRTKAAVGRRGHSFRPALTRPA
jgi:glycosyltransferase involved in cell wall biosynthesis